MHKTAYSHIIHIMHYTHLLVLHGTPNWLLEGSGGLITVLARETEHPLNPFPFCYILLQHYYDTSVKFYNSCSETKHCGCKSFNSLPILNCRNNKGLQIAMINTVLPVKPNTPLSLNPLLLRCKLYVNIITPVNCTIL